MKNSLAIIFLAAFLATGLCVSSVFAQTSSTSSGQAATSTDLSSLIAELQDQIATLQTRINELETELGVKPPQTKLLASPAGGPSSTSVLPAFTITLSLGSRGDDVRNLQTFLAQFSDLYPEGLVTGYYGPLTEKAIKKFQEKYNIVITGTHDTTGYGRLGPRTLARVNELLKEGAGRSGMVPPGLSRAPGLQDKIATTTPSSDGVSATTTPSMIATTTPATIATTTPLIIATDAPPTIPAIATVPQPPLESTTQKWSFHLPDTFNVHSAPAIGPDGTVYVFGGGYGGKSPSYLYAINPSGSEKWRYQIGSSFAPVIGSDGTIYVDAGGIHAFDPQGNKKWSFPKGTLTWQTPALGPDGTIYLGGYTGNGKLYAVNSDGTQKWIFDKGDSNFFNSIVVGADGTIYGTSGFSNYSYTVSGVLTGTSSAYLWAINPNGTKKWALHLPNRTAQLAIGSDNTIYFVTSFFGIQSGYTSAIFEYYPELYAVNPNGTVRWKQPYPSQSHDGGGAHLVIGSDNILYLAPRSRSFALKVLMYNAINGTPLYTNVDSEFSAKNTSYPAIGSDGVIYLGHNVGDGIVGKRGGPFYALHPNGSVKWKIPFGEGYYSPAAIGSDGTVYVIFSLENYSSTYEGYLYALNSTSLGLADSPWPKFRKNNRNTGGEISDSTSSSSSTTSAQTTTTATNTTTGIATTTAITTQTTTTDTTAPVISGIQVTNITSNSATISWTTNEPASSNVFYSTDASVMISPTRIHKTGAINTTSFNISLSGLSSSKIYYYLVSLSDASGNTATSTETLFTTLASGPTTQCNDAIDNDGDGKIDMNDLDCTSSSDTNESPDTAVQLACVDSDPADSSSVKGQLASNNTSNFWHGYVDYCTNSTRLVEMQCQSNGTAYTFTYVDCSAQGKICQGGVCVVSSSTFLAGPPSLASILQSIASALADIKKQIQKLAR